MIEDISRLSCLNHRSFVAEVARQSHITSMLEVGVRDGDSVLAVINAVEISSLALCDDWGAHFGGTNRGSHAHIEKQLEGENIAVLWLDGKSSDLLPKIISQGRKFDLVHIDGDHSREGCLSDLRYALQLASKVIVIHDVFMLDVWLAVSTWLVEVRDRVIDVKMSVMDTGSIAVWVRV